MSANNDPGICGGKKQTDFQKEVCPDKQRQTWHELIVR